MFVNSLYGPGQPILVKLGGRKIGGIMGDGAGDLKECIRILIYRENGHWMAHCLEFDLLADGKSMPDAVRRLIGVIDTHIGYLRENDLMDQLYHPAPLKFWNMLSKAKYIGEIKVPKKRPKIEIPKTSLPVHRMAKLLIDYRGPATTKA